MPAMRLEKKIYDQDWWEKIKRKRAQTRSDINIGKKGVSAEVIKEIKRRLEKGEVVKIRILKSALEVTGLDRREIARRVAERTGSRLIEVRGRTFILAKPLDKGRREDSIVYKKYSMFRNDRKRGSNR